MTFMQLNKNRNLTFWSLHAMGWSAYGISQYLGALLYGKAVAYTKVILIAALTGFILSSWLRLLCRWLWNKPPAVMIGIGADRRLCDRAGLAHSGQSGPT